MAEQGWVKCSIPECDVPLDEHVRIWNERMPSEQFRPSVERLTGVHHRDGEDRSTYDFIQFVLPDDAWIQGFERVEY